MRTCIQTQVLQNFKTQLSKTHRAKETLFLDNSQRYTLLSLSRSLYLSGIFYQKYIYYFRQLKANYVV